MKIGIYKPFKTIYFKDDTNDYASWSNEVINICKILRKFTYADIDILSKTDLKNGEIFQFFKNGNFEQSYDRIIVFNGGIEENHHETLLKLRKLTSRLDFIITDIKLRNYDESLFNNIYTQSINLHKYGAIEKACLFEYQPITLKLDDMQNKEYYYVFGGAEHNRLNDFIEYIWRPECKIYGKSSLLQSDTRIGYNEFMNIMKQTKYSITIADKQYNEIGFVTPRPYENMMSNVIGFIDSKYDQHELILSKYHYLRVSSFLEMKYKMNEFDLKPEYAYQILLDLQQTVSKYADGLFVFNHIK